MAKFIFEQSAVVFIRYAVQYMVYRIVCDLDEFGYEHHFVFGGNEPYSRIGD